MLSLTTKTEQNTGWVVVIDLLLGVLIIDWTLTGQKPL